MKDAKAVFVLTFLVILACLPEVGHSRTWIVPDDALTIQAGIDSATAGDTVLVECGTYYEYNIDLKEAVTVRSETGLPDCVTIDAQSLGRVFNCFVTTTVEGFAITGGYVSDGGGIYCTTSSTFKNCDFVNNHAAWGGGGIFIETGGHPTLTDCRFQGNTSDYLAGAIFIHTDCNPVITGCTFIDNSAVSNGGAYANWMGGFPHFTDCWFESSSAGDRGGAIFSWFSNPTFDYCVFIRNSAVNNGGAVYAHASSAGFNNCTFYENASEASLGGGAYCRQSTLAFENSIVSFSTQGEAIYCEDATAVLTCTDVYGNAGGDYVGCITDWADTNGNISLDPLFCDANNDDYHVGCGSPCLAAGGCGLIGAYGAGCWLGITSVTDVGNDQGRKVRIRWRRACHDSAGSDTTITSYSVWRRVDQFLDIDTGGETHVLSRGLGYPPGEWDYVVSVPACGELSYSTTCETLCDSTSQGICWSVFFVRAHTGDPGFYFDSVPDSGYSIDNLAPAPPPGLMMTSPVELVWEDVPDEDFDYYSVYGSDQQELNGSAVLIGYTIDTAKDITGHVYDYYHVTATDFSGNEGEESSVNNIFAGVPGASDVDDIPVVFALKQNRPNPFDALTVIAFDVPKARHVSLEVLDARGRAVNVLADAGYEPGRHVATWNGTDGSGNVVAAGIYFVRMSAGAFTDMKKVVLLR